MQGKKTGKKMTGILMIVVLMIGFYSVIPSGCRVEAAGKGYCFTYNKVTVSMDKKAAKFIKKAGEPVAVKVKKSCAYKGKDRTYQYQDFILYTYSNSNNGPEYVNCITFLTDQVKTKEGIKIGSTLEEVTDTYGKGKENFGVYTFTKGTSKLQIEITDDIVSNIRYISKSFKTTA